MKISDGMQDYVMVTGSVKAGMDGGVLAIYGSPTSQAAADALIPADANDSVAAATLIVVISNNGAGTGINMATSATDGVLAKAAGETWKGTAVATGYMSFARWEELSDTGVLSTTEKRYQYTVGTLNKEIIVGNASKTLGEEQRLDSFYQGLPDGS